MQLNKTIIEDLLDELKGYIYDLEQMRFTLSELEGNRDVQHLLNHRLHTAVEVCIDIAMHIASSLELPNRDSAIDVIILLGKYGIIPAKLAKSFQKAPKLRNLLVHGYARVDYGHLYRDFKDDIKEIKEFAQGITAYLDRI